MRTATCISGIWVGSPRPQPALGPAYQLLTMFKRDSSNLKNLETTLKCRFTATLEKLKALTTWACFSSWYTSPGSRHQPQHAYSVGCWWCKWRGPTLPKITSLPGQSLQTGQCKEGTEAWPAWSDRDILEGLSQLQNSRWNFSRPLLQLSDTASIPPPRSQKHSLENHLHPNIYLMVYFPGTVTFKKHMCLPAPQGPCLAHLAHLTFEFFTIGYVRASL